MRSHRILSSWYALVTIGVHILLNVSVRCCWCVVGGIIVGIVGGVSTKERMDERKNGKEEITKEDESECAG